MKQVLGKLKKLKGRGARELRVRAGQALAARAERLGLSRQARVPSDSAFSVLFDPVHFGGARPDAAALLNRFRARTAPRFFGGFHDRAETVRVLRERFGGGERDAVIRKANRVVEGVFDLLGLSGLPFGRSPDWHLEPISGRRAPLQHWSRIEYLNADVAGDKKFTWELNRHQHFQTLGRAYWRTGDERYAECFASHLSSWMDANPPKVGINWSSSLEVSLRAISWLWAFHFFKDSPALTPELYSRALKFLYLHARHLETYLSTYFSPNTHLTGEALGLYYLGAVLPEFRRARRWRERGARILTEALDAHVRPDGVYFEQASYYHRYTADFYTHLQLLCAACDEPVGPEVALKLGALLDHLMYITRPDGTSPRFGDDDGGRLVMLDERAWDDFRATLATNAALTARGDYKYVAEDASEETLWLLGPEGLSAFDHLRPEPPATCSRAFPEGGYFVMRDGWEKTSNYLLADCGPHGALNYGHAHADALSVEVAARGRTVLVDAGTYTYTGSARMRDYFRSSAAHNTLTVDGESSSVPAGPFRWGSVARSTLKTWLSHARFDFFEGSHDGYERLACPVTHTRSILFLKGRYWVVRDRADSRGDCRQRYDLHFHFAPGVSPAVTSEGGAAALREEAGGLLILSFGGEWEEEDGWVSPCYGRRERAAAFRLKAVGEGGREFMTFMVPAAEAGARGAHARELETASGRVFEFVAGGSRDLLMTGAGELVEYGRISSDFEWCWARFADGVGARLEELVLVGGRRFYLDGRAVFDSKRRAGFVTGRRVGGELVLETDTEETLRVPAGGGERVYSF
jgi:hypothetical protein